MADEQSDNGEGYERPRGEEAAEAGVSKEGDIETGIKVKIEVEKQHQKLQLTVLLRRKQGLITFKVQTG